MNNTLDQSIPYKDFTEMNQDMLRQVNLTIEKNPTDDSDESSSKSGSSSEDEAPPPKKKPKFSFNLSSKLMRRKVMMKIKTL
jgi:hypothetical protein